MGDINIFSGAGAYFGGRHLNWTKKTMSRTKNSCVDGSLAECIELLLSKLYYMKGPEHDAARELIRLAIVPLRNSSTNWRMADRANEFISVMEKENPVSMSSLKRIYNGREHPGAYDDLVAWARLRLAAFVPPDFQGDSARLRTTVTILAMICVDPEDAHDVIESERSF